MPIFEVNVTYSYKSTWRIAANSKSDAMDIVEDLKRMDIAAGICEDCGSAFYDYDASISSDQDENDFNCISADYPITIKDIKWGKQEEDDDTEYPESITETAECIAEDRVEGIGCNINDWDIKGVIKDYLNEKYPKREVLSFKYKL